VGLSRSCGCLFSSSNVVVYISAIIFPVFQSNGVAQVHHIWAQPSILYIPSLQLGHERVSLLMSLRLRCCLGCRRALRFLRSSDFKHSGQVQLLHSPHFHTDEKPFASVEGALLISLRAIVRFRLSFLRRPSHFGDRTQFRCSVSV
jgi:hypothetical protein